MTPYYNHAGITIYHGDCREVLPAVPGGAHLMLTDPPYGLGLGTDNVQTQDASHLGKKSYLSYQDSYENFVAEIVPRLNLCIDATPRAAVFTGPHIHEQRKPNAIGGVWFPCAIGRTAWGSKNFLPVLLYGIPPNAGQHRPTVFYQANIEPRLCDDHPCVKPLNWMKWLVALGSSEGETICDPFMGSGTSLRAAKDLGRKAVGIEIEEKYCEIAARRLSQEVLSFG